MAASIRRKFIGDGTIAGNGTHTFIWNNPPHSTVLGYFAYADPPAPATVTGSSTGEVGIVAVRHQSTRTGDGSQRSTASRSTSRTSAALRAASTSTRAGSRAHRGSANGPADTPGSVRLAAP